MKKAILAALILPVPFLSVGRAQAPAWHPFLAGRRGLTQRDALQFSTRRAALTELTEQ